MQSMNVSYLSSFGARRSKDGFGQRSAWTMWVVAALLAVLATALPLHRPVSADDPVFTVNVTNIDYETATASLTITGLPSTIKSVNWIVRVNYKSPSDSYGTSLNAGPGLDRPDHDDDLDGEVDEPGEGGDDFVAVRNGNQITAGNISMVKLVPDSEHTIEVTLYEVHSGGSWVNRGKGSETFDSKGGCYVHTKPDGDDPDSDPDPDPDNDPAHDRKGPNNFQPKWFGGNFNFSKQEETELTLDVYVTNSGLAGVNSGRCIYYSYRARGGADRGPFSAYVYTKSGGRRAWIKLGEPPLLMGTTYDFTVSFHPTLQDGNVGTQGRTLGSRMAVESVNVDSITETSARATIEVDNPGSQTHIVYYRYFKTADEGDLNLQPTGGSEDTVNGPVIYDLSGLTAATEYKVEASLESGFPTNQSEFDIFPTKLNKPTGLTVTSDDEQLEVEWTKPVGGDAIGEYIVQWKSGSETFADAETENREQTVAHVSGTTTYDAIIPGLENGTEYTVHVIAKNESGEATSEEKKGTPATIPDEPTSMEVTPGNEKLTLTWVAPIETGGASITGFVVEYKQNTALTWTTHTPIGPSTLTAIITGLTNDILYDVRVRADNGVVADPYNWAVNTGTPVRDPSIGGVSVPSNTITKTTATATVTIDDAKTGDEQAVHFRHRVNTSGTSWTTATPKNTDGPSINFDLTSLTGNTEYIVEAWLATDTSDVESTTFTTSPVEPDAPTNARITGHGDGKLIVEWNAPSDPGGSTITSYKVQWKDSSVADWNSPEEDSTADGNVLKHTIERGLTNGTEYAVQIIAVTSVGDGSPSNEAKGTPSREPYAPTIQNITGGNERLVVTWDEPDDGGSPITGYTVQWKSGIEMFEDAATDNREATVTTPTLTHTIQNLANDTLYTVQVRATNDDGDSLWSLEDTGTPVPNPSIGIINVRTKSQTGATLTVTIERSDINNEQTVNLRHRIKTPPGTWKDETPQDTGDASVDFDLSGLTGNTVYEVEAWLAADTTDRAEYEFTTSPVIPAAPTITSVTHGDQNLAFTWTAPSMAGGADIERYVIQWKEFLTVGWASALEHATTDETVLSYTIGTGLPNGTRYAFRVRADNSVQVEPGKEYNWAHSDGTPSRKPDAPTVQSVTPGPAQLVVTWSEPANGGDPITNYKVEYKEQGAPSWRLHKEVDHNTLTETIGSLTNGTIYVVQVSAKNINGYGDPSVEEPGTPRPDPSVDSISVADSTITQTTAVATVTIADPTGDTKMVHLRYRVSSSSEVWTTPTSQSTTTNSVAFPQFTGLKSDTEYRVEASFDSTFNSGVQFKLFTTKRPTVLSVVVDVSTISQAGATATVTIEEPNGKQQTVRLRYRPSTQDDWSITATDAGEIPVNTSTDVAAVPISDLKSGTLYEVEASLESDYSQSATTTFTTESPSLTGLTFSEVMQESAKATIGIQAPNGRSLPVFVRYRKVTDPVNGLWEYVDTSNTGATADAPLSNLSSGTEYEVQASLVSTFLVDTISETFTTHDPSLSALTVMSITLTGATLKVDIQAPNGESQTINYRYRPVTQTDWTTTATDAGSDSITSTTGSAEFTLASLTSGTQYQIQVSLDTDLNNPTLPVLEATLTTLTPDPSISDVAIDAKQTTAKATITIANPGTSGNTVHLHFREHGTNAWSSPALTSTTTTSEAIIDMTGLAERTTYEVEVALNSGFTSSTTVTFTTLVTPTITSVSVDDITKTTATATVAIANPDGTDRTVHLQYRIKDATPADTWTKAMEDSETGSQEFDLASLKPGTTYEVEASFDSNFGTGVEDTEFTTTYAPSISSVSVGDITKTTATATVSIANPDGTSRTVHLQYRVKDADPEDTWTKAMEDTDTGSQEFGLTGLTPGTTYEVQASFDGNFSPHKDTTFTTVFEPSISAVGVGDIDKTTATATVIIANPDGTDQTVNLQYREYNQEPEAEWTKPTPKDTATGSETFDLTSLTPGTTYEVQASFDSNFDTYKDTTFTTKFAPTISAVRVDPDSITKTTASVIVIIANPDGTDQTVQLQYRIKDPQGNWSSTQTEDTTTGTATINLTGLTAGTTYEVEVSLASGFGSTQTATFTTKYEPSISSVSMGSVTQTTATAAISIDNADGSTQTVHLQYREKDATPQASWMSATPETSTTSAASIDISGLTADKTYEVEAWLANDTAKKVTATFTTLKAPNGNPTPSVSSVSMGSITMTTATATVNIANPGTAANTVNLRHSVKDANSWTDHTKSETGSTVSFPLSSLIAGTTYEVEAWLGSDTVNKVTASFTTSPAPSISSISVGSITRTSASATVNIANSGTAQNTVNLRYSVQDANSWTDHTKTETGSTVAFPLSSLMAGTTYEVEAWLGSDTGNKATTTFTTTLPAAVLSPTINSVRVGNILETTATATVNIDNADGSTQTARLQYRTTNPQGNWSSTYENTSTTGTATINFDGMTAGTRYQVQAWLASDASDKATASFQTQQAAPNNPPPQRSPVNPTPPVIKSPEVASVSVTNETQTTADATVKIDNAGTAQNTVNLRYSVDGEDSWTDHTKTETGSTVAFPLSSLTADTTYEVEAWLGSDTDNKVTATFTTSMAPSISSISVGDITKTSATATVNIRDAGTAQNTVNLRHSVDGEDSWTDHTKTEAGSTVEFPLSSLTADTTYEVEAWLGSDTDNKVTATFTTSMAPSISSIGVGGITKTSATATVNIRDAGTAQNTVNLRHSVDGEDIWTDHTKTEAGSTVEFPLSSLTAGTTYEVEAWLGSDTDNKVTATFMTIQAAAVTPPSISSVRVLNIAQTNARVVVGLANAAAEQKVYMQYKLSSAQWPTTLPQPTTQMNGSATFILSNLTAGTGYHTRVSLNNDMSDATTRPFTTTSPPPQRSPENPTPPVIKSPEVSSVTFADIYQTSANATVNIRYPGSSQKTVRLRYRIKDTTWSTPPKIENTRGSSATFALMSLTAGTSYEVQAWLTSNDSPPPGTQIYEFNTLDEVAVADPVISSLQCENIGQTYATAIVVIEDAGTGMKEVFLKHSMDGTDEWTQLPFTTITYTDSTSINLTGLQDGTAYQVAVALSEDFSDMIVEQCITLIAPSLSGVSVGNKTQTSAVATVSIANAGTGQKTVLLQYREFGESEWIPKDPQTTGGASATFDLTGLEPRTTYEVKAYLNDDPDAPQYAVFTTLAPGPGVSGISVGSKTQTSAVATVNIAYAGGAQKTVHLHYREFGESEWILKAPKTTEGASAPFDLTGLTPNTKYEVEASLSSDFAGAIAVTFTTLAPEPSVSSVRVQDISQTAATAIAEIANSDGTSQTVHVRYRTTTPQDEWREAPETTSTTEVASSGLTGLTADTKYEVQASLDGSFPDDLTKNATFTTLRFPSISNLEVEDETKNSAIAVITIEDPDDSSHTVRLRYRTTTPQGVWSSTQTANSNAVTIEKELDNGETSTIVIGRATINMSGLTADTEYEVQVSLTADFGVAVSDTFRTLPLDPVVSGISVDRRKQTTARANIDIANSDGIKQIVHLQYRTTTPRGTWSDIQTTTSTTDSASKELSGLTPGTEYDVQASLDDSFPATRTKSAIFTTLRGPSIASFEAENIGRNGATVRAMIADSHGVAQTVYVRHRDVRYNAWKPTQQTDSVDDVASIRLRGLSSGTEYIAEASLDNSFPDGGTKSVTFTTKKREDDDESSSGSVIVQAARATNIPLLGFSPQMLRFTAIEGGDNPPPQAFLVWNRAQGSMSFTLSNQQEWLSQQPTSGVSNGPDDQVTITASVDSSALASGQYVDIINIDVSSSGKSPAQVIVVLDVLPPDYIRQFVSRDEGGVVILPDGTVKIVVQPLSSPKDVDIELMKVNLQAHGQPPGEQERVVVAIESNTYEPGGDTPEDVAYSPYVELWVQLPQEDAAACSEGKTRVYSVEAETWNLVEHRCETDESGHVWAVAEVERLGQFALVIDDAPVPPPPTPAVAALAPPANSEIKDASAATVRTSLPAQPPTPVPTAVPTAVPVPSGKTTVAPTMMPTATATAVPADNEPSAPTMQASAGDGGSGGFGRIILAALGVPMLIGTLIVVYLLYRERRRRDDARFIERSGGDW